MARRIKEEASVHRIRIATAAQELFKKQGIDHTSMDEIASKAGYSKATLYVYYKNKDEIVGYLVLSSMLKLKELLETATQSKKIPKQKYLDICNAIVAYEKEYPFYFSMVLEHINIDFEKSKCEESERAIFQVGEEINTLLEAFLREGIGQVEYLEIVDIKTTIFMYWGMISGLISLASSKEEYIIQEMNVTKEAFLNSGFLFLFEALGKNKKGF